MANLSSLANLASAARALSNLILVSPNKTVGYQPQPLIGTDGQLQAQQSPVLFNYEGEQTATLTSDITDHFVEDNTAIQDQVALRPEIITTHGFIGELNDVVPEILAPLKAVADKLTFISPYAPSLSLSALIAYNNAAFLYNIGINAKNAAVEAWSSINGSGGESVIDSSGIDISPNQTKQQVVFQQFYGYWRSRTLFTIQTPWAVFQNCVIQTLRAIQDAETNVITDFEVTFKAMRFAQTVVQNSGALEGRAAAQASGLTDLGTSTPPVAAVSFLSQVA